MKHTFTKFFFAALVVFAAVVIAHPVHAQTVPPSAYPAAGEYRNGIRVSLSSTEPSNFIIKYTLNGSTPSCPPSAYGTTYSSQFNLIADTTVKAVTCESGSSSVVETFQYTFTSGGSSGGVSSNPADNPYSPSCVDDAAYCPPSAPTTGVAGEGISAPVFGNVIANSYGTVARDLSAGTSGSDVTGLQQFLVSKGYLVMPQGTAFGYFGSLTRDAVIKFQKANGITPAAGYFGVKTRARYNALLGILPDGSNGDSQPNLPIPGSGCMSAGTSIFISGTNSCSVCVFAQGTGGGGVWFNGYSSTVNGQTVCNPGALVAPGGATVNDGLTAPSTGVARN